MMPAVINVVAAEIVGDLQFRVEHGELLWGDDELCFPSMDLYRNRVVHALELEAVV